MVRGDDELTEPLGEDRTLPLPDPSSQWVLASPGPAPTPKRRRLLLWAGAAIAAIGLLVAAWFASEAIARATVTSAIRSSVIAQLGLPADQEITVDVDGSVLPQLIAGTLDHVTISGDDVPLDQVTGDVRVVATGVPVRGDAPIQEASATVVLDEGQLRALLGTVAGFPADSLGLDPPHVTVSTEVTLFGVTVPVGVVLTPTAGGGDLILSPAALQVAGAEVSAETLRTQLGGIADVVARDWTVCVAQYLPAGLTLTAVEVTGGGLTADFDIDGRIATDPSLQENGTCP